MRPSAPGVSTPAPSFTKRVFRVSNGELAEVLSHYNLKRGLSEERALLLYLHKERTRLLRTLAKSMTQVGSLRARVDETTTERIIVEHKLAQTTDSVDQIRKATTEVRELVQDKLETFENLTDTKDPNDHHGLFSPELVAKLRGQRNEARAEAISLREELLRVRRAFECQEKEYIGMIHEKRDRVELLQRTLEGKNQELEEIRRQARAFYDTTQRQKSSIADLLRSVSDSQAMAENEKRKAMREQIRAKKLKETLKYLQEEMEVMRNENRCLRFQLKKISDQMARNRTRGTRSSYGPVYQGVVEKKSGRSRGSSSASPEPPPKKKKKKRPIRRRPKRKRRNTRSRKKARAQRQQQQSQEETSEVEVVVEEEEEEQQQPTTSPEEERQEEGDRPSPAPAPSPTPEVEVEVAEQSVVNININLSSTTTFDTPTTYSSSAAYSPEAETEAEEEEAAELLTSDVPISPEEPLPPEEDVDVDDPTMEVLVEEGDARPITTTSSTAVSVSIEAPNRNVGEDLLMRNRNRIRKLRQQQTETPQVDTSKPFFSWFPCALPINTKQPYKQAVDCTRAKVRLIPRNGPLRVQSSKTPVMSREYNSSMLHSSTQAQQQLQQPKPPPRIRTRKVTRFRNGDHDVIEVTPVAHNAASLESRIELRQRIHARRVRANRNRHQIESRKRAIRMHDAEQAERKASLIVKLNESFPSPRQMRRGFVASPMSSGRKRPSGRT